MPFRTSDDSKAVCFSPVEYTPGNRAQSSQRPHGRVKRACDRCRRNKSRCDDFRPCSICVRAGAECLSFGRTKHIRPTKRKKETDQDYSDSDNDGRPFSDTGPPSLITNDPPSLKPASNLTSDTEQPARSSKPETKGKQTEEQGTQSIIELTRMIFRLSSEDFDQFPTSALPHGDNHLPASPTQPLSLETVLGCVLPPPPMMCLLLEDYFESVHWFSLVIYEPKFRAKFEAICDGYASQSQKPFLLLLSAVLALAAWYNSKRHSSVHGHDAAFWADWASTLLRHLELETFDIINGCTLEHIQICTLLASYHSYHGKPKAASALLGATIKAAQAIGLHQEPHGKSVDDTEEIKRIWWTIYTWDRWASTTLGRPLGIDDDECNISMPNEIYENRRFLAWVDAELICYSVYQRELNKLYVIASPVLKTLFGNIPSSYSKGVARERQRNLLEETGKRLKNWREALPEDLVFHFDADASPDECALIKARRLQALSLQLTFDHLIIIFNHSLLVHQIRSLCGGGRTQFPTDFEQPDSKQTELSPIASSEASLHAAFHISRIAQLPQTARLAAESHLVGFLGINLLNAAIVLVVSALSSPLTDRAQEAKRSVTMIFRLQKILGERSQLALQSSLVLRSMILMITSRETEAMLRPKESTREAGLYGLNDDQTSQDDPYVLVQETVRVSLDAPFPPLQCSGVMSPQRTITGQTGEETVPLDDASAPAGKAHFDTHIAQNTSLPSERMAKTDLNGLMAQLEADMGDQMDGIFSADYSWLWSFVEEN